MTAKEKEIQRMKRAMIRGCESNPFMRAMVYGGGINFDKLYDIGKPHSEKGK